MPERSVAWVTPLVLLVANVVLGIAAVKQLSGGLDALHVVRATAIVLLMAWLLLETPLAFRVSRDDRHGEDRGTVRVNGVSRALAILAALAWPPLWTGWSWIHAAGLLIFVAGFVFRLAAIRELGRFYSHKVRRTDDHQTIDTGPYRLVRHPAYLGVIAAHLGFSLVFFNPLGVAAVPLLVIPAFIWRIKVEDPVLMKIPGYDHYARHHARLIPGIW